MTIGTTEHKAAGQPNGVYAVATSDLAKPGRHELIISIKVGNVSDLLITALDVPEPAKLPKQFKYADKMKLKVAVTIGPDEAANGQVAVKNLATGEQVVVTREAAVETIRGLLKNA